MFVGRKRELAYLEDLYNRDQSNILCMYGHKGVGKTSLMLSFANNKNYIYMMSRACTEEQTLYMLGLENGIEYAGSQPTFTELFEKLSFSGNGKKILIIDEFHNIVKYSTNFMPELVKFVESQGNNIFVILCSSSISFVENTFVSKVGTLAQRLSGFFKVNPLSFADCVKYFDGYDTLSCMEVYSLLGGMPSLWASFSDKRSVAENIKSAMLDGNGALRSAGIDIITEELREINVYSTILYYLANDKNKLNELHSNTGFSRAKISVYIKNLMEREIVEKVFSFDNASSTNAKKGVYRIKSPYLHFFFKFIFKYESKLVSMGPDKFYESVVLPELDDFYEEHFKSICTEFLTLLNQMGQLPIKATSIGEWVGKKGNIDVVMQDDEDSIVAFCNWKNPEITMSDYKRYLGIASDARIHADYIVILAKGAFSQELSQFADNLDNIMLIDANTL